MVTAQHTDAGGANGTKGKHAAVPHDVVVAPALDKDPLASVAHHSRHGLCSGVAAPATALNASLTRQ